MNEAQPSAPQLAGQVGELRMTLQITRAATGNVEEIELTSRITDPDTHEQLLKDIQNGSHTLDSK